MKGEPLFLLREGVLFHRFPDSIVVYHPDSGDTLAFEIGCGALFDALAVAKGPLSAAGIVEHLFPHDALAGVADIEQVRIWLDEFEGRDLIRRVDPF